jgi:ligand-binding sensor domain-containing protein
VRNDIFAVVRYIFHILSLLFFTSITAQHSVMRHFDTKNGLPSNEVYQLLSDSKGYIWICTDGGLVKYNGNTFKTFTSVNGMPDNTIFQAKEDKFGRIWYISYAGKLGYISNDSVYVIDLGEKIQQYVTNGLITSIAFDSSNNLFIGRRNQEKISFLKVKPPYRVQDITTVWEENKAGLAIHMIDQKDFVFCDSRIKNKENECEITLYDNEKLISKDIELIDPKTVLFTRGYLKEDHLYLIFGSDLIKFDIHTGISKKRKLVNDLVTVASVEQGCVVVGAAHSGMLYLNEELDDLNREKDLEGLTVTYLVKDYQGGTWISTLQSGVFYIPRYSVSFISLPNFENEKAIKAIKLHDSALLISVYSGKLLLMTFNSDKGPFISELIDDSQKELSELHSLYTDNSGQMFVSTSKGTSVVDMGHKKLIEIGKVDKLSTIGSVRVNSNEQIFLRISEVIQLEGNNGKQSEHIYASDDRLSCISYNSKTNSTLIGGLRGLYHFHNKAINGTKDNLLSCRVEDVKIDKHGICYVATRTHGLIIIKKGKPNDTISVKQGLISNICKSLTLDSDRVWVCTHKGMSTIRFSENNPPQIYNYQIENFLGPSTANGVVILSNKVVFFSGRTFYWFDKIDQATGSRSGNITVRVNEKDHDPTSTIFLSHDPPDIKICFEALLYDLGGDLNYRYRLNENEAWTQTKENQITLAKLASGDYKIDLQAMDKQGHWFALNGPLKISIRKPFYQNWWFILVMIACAVVLVYFSVKTRYSRILEREKTKNELKINMLELETKVVKAQMNPHFIFNSLNSIQQFILANDNENAYVYLTKFSKLVRKLLESTTTENISLEDEIDLLNRYVEIESLRFENTFTYSLHVEAQLKAASLRIPHMIIQPFVENAIWHGLLHSKGERTLRISFLYLNERCIRCLVEDSGVGRKTNKTSLKDKRSLAIEFIKKRLELIDQLTGSGCGFTIVDKTKETHGETGTIIDMKLPIMN